MTRRENYMVEKIDRAREAPAIKAERQRRAMYLKAQARRAVTSMLSDIQCPEERAAILGDAIQIAAEHRLALTGAVSTATGLNSLAAELCGVFRLPRAIKNAAAEQAFAKLTRADNDRGESE